ncbi:NADPH-dependent diflavin oxidoreductase 1 isoform X2 [Orussus abietinus]|nr:NADPH-dependent diflavin oxidoreductase 1 isoform X2 [Orussus abietinus]XP_012283697.1 NADPH-dependent diflavin oxidoreductase 1 isoform X2 [Orussus abietinus]
MEANITLLYGSETGTAQDTAELIWRDAKRYGLKSSVSAMDEYNIKNLISEELVVFVVSTTGQGEVPANMKQFWRCLLRKSLPVNTLNHLKYAVLGLGDSSYQKFNFAAKKLNKRLGQLGGQELLPIGLADDQHDLGIDAVTTTWTQELWTKISNLYGIELINVQADGNEIVERFNVDVITTNDTRIFNNGRDLHSDIYESELHVNDELRMGTVIENFRTTSVDHFQDVRLIKISAENIQYEPGDVLYIRPKNSAVQVQRFFMILNSNNVNVHPNMVIRVTEKEINVPQVLKRDLTLKEIVEQYWDLSFKPRRSTMMTLARTSDDDLEKEKLFEFTTTEGQEELFGYVNRPRRNILEVLNDFPHTTSKLNVRLLFEIMSPIKPRAFSIASSMKATQSEVHVLVAVVKYKTKLLEPRLGLCSNWLASLTPGERVIFWIQKGTFKFDYSKPMILIGPGTGVAPFRSLLLDKAVTNKNLNDCILFFGCRNEKRDYHCKEDFEFLMQNRNLRLFCAFSRDQADKIYVQHVIERNDQLCWEFMKNNANIYVAGNSKNMPDSVREEFVNIIGKFSNLSKEYAESYVQQMEKEGRYQIETWS